MQTRFPLELFIQVGSRRGGAILGIDFTFTQVRASLTLYLPRLNELISIESRARSKKENCPQRKQEKLMYLISNLKVERNSICNEEKSVELR